MVVENFRGLSDAIRSHWNFSTFRFRPFSLLGKRTSARTVLRYDSSRARGKNEGIFSFRIAECRERKTRRGIRNAVRSSSVRRGFQIEMVSKACRMLDVLFDEKIRFVRRVHVGITFCDCIAVRGRGRRRSGRIFFFRFAFQQLVPRQRGGYEPRLLTVFVSTI